MSEYAELEISLQLLEGANYSVEMRSSQPGSDADVRLGQGQAMTAQFDFEDLRSKSMDAQAYGKALSASLFADKNVLMAFSEAVATAQSIEKPLRIRLYLGPGTSKLHVLYWETLRNPKDDTPLFTGEQMVFSRYMSSLDWRPVRLRSKADLKALVAIANPSDLGEFELAEVKVAEELKRAKDALGSIPVTALPASAKEHCTLTALVERLREGYDVLYLVAHGAFVKDEAWLWLEDEKGKVARASGLDLVTRIKELQRQPRLIVLASCQSAGAGSGQALQAIGPRLTEAGVPAVVAMQGNITMDTVSKFMPAMFEELQKDGSIDRAVSVARGLVREQPDHWMPVLFMRLKSGRIWYEPGFGEETGFKKWPSLLGSIKEGKCTPILGSGLYEPLIGTWREMAVGLAEKYGYPLSFFYRDALPQVTQFLSVNQDVATLLRELQGAIRVGVQNRCGDSLEEELKKDQLASQQLLSKAGALLRKQNPLEQHAVLARLPLPIYISTNYDNLLADALTEVGKDPQVVICPWSDRFYADSIYNSEPKYLPTVERPLVYHLFGHFSEPASMVVTEDDYFDYLIGVTNNKELIPFAVRRAMNDTALMFLGFQLDDWSFRVFFRSVMGLQGGAARRSIYSHFAVQIDIDETRNLNPRGARQYLEDYFKSSDISIFWGQSEDFLQELGRQWQPD